MTDRVAGRAPALILTGVLLALVSATGFAQSEDPAAPRADDVAALLSRIVDSRADVATLDKLIAASEGEIRDVLERRRDEEKVTIAEEINTLGRRIAESPDDEQAGQMRDTMVDLLQGLMPALREQIDRHKAETIALITAEPAESPRAAMAREIAVEKSTGKLIERYALYLRSIETLAEYGVETGPDREYLIERLTELAETLSAALELAIESVDDTGFILGRRPTMPRRSHS